MLLKLRRMELSSVSGRVLVVDDDDIFLRAYGTVLERAGFRVEAVNNPTLALTRVATQRYDAIVSDVRMPETDGISLLKAAREHDATVPFVLMSGSPTVESAMSAVDHGAQRYLQKPIDIDHFVATVSEAVMRRATAEDLNSLSHRLDNALEGLWMAYQPIVAFSKRRPLAYEALLRSADPGVKSPTDVLDLAEKTRRLFDVGRVIRAAVARDVAQLREGVEVFVNLHPGDLHDPQLYEPDAPLSQHAKRVVLEITERASVAHDQALNQHIDRLRALGFRVAVDDLGAGYAGLTTLARVQPEFVKLDGSLVRGIEASTVNQLVITAVMTLAAELKLRVIAEAIETRAELSTLRALGVEYMQGYHFAKPGKPFVTVDDARY